MTDVPPAPDRPARVTRRRVVAGAAAGVGAVAGIGFGRYAVGDEFEEHVAGVLGISPAAATVLLARARERMGSEYIVHAAAFAAATTFPGEHALPASAQRRAIERLIGNVLTEHEDMLVGLGLQARLEGPCRGLLRG